MSNGLRITVPLQITDAILKSSDVPENDYPAWSPTATYALGARAIRGHRIWESAQAGNTGNDPETSGAAWWLKVSATNRWRMFDQEQITRTAHPSSMTYVFEPGRPIGAAHVLGVYDVDYVQMLIEDIDGGTPDFDTGQAALGLLAETPDWWAYCFGPWTMADSQHYADLPYVVNPRITVEFGGGDAMAVQVLLLGTDAVFGNQYGSGVMSGARVRYDRSSNFSANEWGIPTMKSTALVATINFTLRVRSDEVDPLNDFYKENSNKVCLFTICDRWRVTKVLGKINTFEALLEGPIYSDFAFEIRGVPQQ